MWSRNIYRNVFNCTIFLKYRLIEIKCKIAQYCSALKIPRWRLKWDIFVLNAQETNPMETVEWCHLAAHVTLAMTSCHNRYICYVISVPIVQMHSENAITFEIITRAPNDGAMQPNTIPTQKRQFRNLWQLTPNDVNSEWKQWTKALLPHSADDAHMWSDYKIYGYILGI